jgi:hypothetical protein
MEIEVRHGYSRKQTSRRQALSQAQLNPTWTTVEF